MFSATMDMPQPPSGGEVLKGRNRVQMALCPSTLHPPGARSDPIPQNNSNQVKIRNYMAVASHNRTAISYLYMLQK